MNNLVIAAGLCIALAGSAGAQQAGANIEIYVERLGGVYTQTWTAQYLGSLEGYGNEVFVAGLGKSGDFYGVLRVDCEIRENSEWIATGGYLAADDVPAEAMPNLRRVACG